eukprot:m.35316 g.35316  ORF g.35316 m.35316 type:complete len:51 (+) comp32096_c0_seq2:1883-2035(+)
MDWVLFFRTRETLQMLQIVSLELCSITQFHPFYLFLRYRSQFRCVTVQYM